MACSSGLQGTAVGCRGLASRRDLLSTVVIPKGTHAWPPYHLLLAGRGGLASWLLLSLGVSICTDCGGSGWGEPGMPAAHSRVPGRAAEPGMHAVQGMKARMAQLASSLGLPTPPKQ